MQIHCESNSSTPYFQRPIIHLVRDGRAVAESARRRWLAPPDPKYLLEKARWVPLQDIPYYGIRFLKFQLGRLRTRDKAPTSWGPRFAGLDELVRTKSLIEVCGIQWKTCVESAHNALLKIPSDRTLTIKYEDLIADPLEVSAHIFDFVGLDFAKESREFIKEFVVNGNVHKWKKYLTNEDLEKLMPHIEDTLKKFGYLE